MKLTEYVFNGTVHNVVDGDTIDVDIDLGFRMTTRQRLRLAGLDTPERGQPGYQEAKDFLTSMVLGNSVMVETFKASKFGYFLAEVMINGCSVNGMLVTKGLAKPYSGGKKE